MQLIKIKNCNFHLLLLGIDMNMEGSINLLHSAVLPRIASYSSIMYEFATDTIRIEVPDGVSIPDLSVFGEVIINDSSMG